MLDPSSGNLRFEGSILPEGNGAVLPRIPATLDMADNLFRSQYGLDDLIGWVTLHLLDREEDRLGMAEADRLERLRQRLRLDKPVRPRSPVRSPERFIPRGCECAAKAVGSVQQICTCPLSEQPLLPYIQRAGATRLW